MADKLNTPDNNHRHPEYETFVNAAKFAIVDDKPILMDYWTDSIDKTVALGIRTNGNNEKVLIRSKNEYTSSILNLYKSGKDFVIITENSIYLVDAGIPRKQLG